jgi:hypothetical protein
VTSRTDRRASSSIAAGAVSGAPLSKGGSGALLRGDLFRIRRLIFVQMVQKQLAEAGFGIAKKSQKGFQPMQDPIRIDKVHSSALRTEIGERLRQALSRAQPELPSSLENSLNRLREVDGDYSPSIVPSIDRL